MPKDKPTALWRSIHDSLRDDIAQGRYGPGARLPTEAALAARRGVAFEVFLPVFFEAFFAITAPSRGFGPSRAIRPPP